MVVDKVNQVIILSQIMLSTYNNSGGTLNSGYVSGFTVSTNLQVDDLSDLIQEEIIHS